MSNTTPTPPDYEQPERTWSNSGGTETVTKKFKGAYDDLKDYADTLEIGGTAYDECGLPLRSINLVRTVADLATLTLEFSQEDSGSSGEDDADPISVSWSMKHTQKLVPLWRYCGPSASNANRGRIEAWRREQDAALYSAFKWRLKNGAVQELMQNDLKLAKKFYAGIESVMRFYPTVVKTTVYTKGKIENVGDKLAHIDSPGSPWDDASPGGSDAWLKIGDDVSISADGTQTRTETWLGEEGFDANLYGDNDRWDWGTI